MQSFIRKILALLLVLFIAFVIAAWAMHGDSIGLLEANCLLCKLGFLFILLSGSAVLSGRTLNQLLYILRISRFRICKDMFANAVPGRSPPQAA
jgi:hypothetical protein